MRTNDRCLGVVWKERNGLKLPSRTCPNPALGLHDYGHEWNVPLCKEHAEGNEECGDE